MIVLYTAIFGNSDTLKPAPLSPARCVCFTDNDKLSDGAQGWAISRMAVPIGSNARAAARSIKLRPHSLFPEADAWVWTDASMRIRSWSRLMTDAAGADIACLAHPDRTNCYDEARMVVRLERAHPSRVAEAIDIYRAEGFNPTALSTTGLLYRRNVPKVVAFNMLWRSHLDRFGINDQVHIDFCAWKTGAAVRHLFGHYRENPYAFYDKADHHRRRQPQYFPGDRCEHYLP